MSAATATVVLDGDHKNHPFRGNQHVTASRESATAGAASRKAKRAEKAGDPKALKKAHRGAYHAHMAALEDAKGTTRKYHRTMAKFHGKQAGVVLDAVEDQADDEDLGPILTLEGLDPAAPVLDKATGEVNVFQSGDKVVGLDDNKDYTVTGQRGYQVSVKGEPKPIHANRLKLASGGKAPRLVLDDAGLFGDVSGGYIKGTVSRNGKVLATVVLSAGVETWQASEELKQAMRDTQVSLNDEADVVFSNLSIQFGDSPSEIIEGIAGVVGEAEQYAADNEAQMAAEAKARSEREAQLAADESTRAAALAEAQAFGKGKPGFVGAIADRGGDAIKGALARKPVGSFVLVAARNADNGFGFAMFSRQKLTKTGRGIDPAGKVGNVQVSGTKATPAEAYEAGTAALAKAGGVVLGGDQEPAGKAFTVRGVDFEAVRFMAPIPHWRLKIMETGEVWEPGTAGIKGDSVPKLIASVEDLASRSKTDAEWRFNLGLPKKDDPAVPAAAYRYALVNRPAMIGGLPRGLNYTVESRPAAGQPHYEMARHGILVADRELTEAELKNFELAELIEGPALDRVAAEVAAGMQKYAAQYVEAEQDNPGLFRDQVLDKAARPASGVMRSIASPDALVDRVLVLLQDMVKASDEPVRRSEQFLSYMKFINEGKATPGMLEQINMDTRLEDGEAEVLIAAAKAAKPAAGPDLEKVTEAAKYLSDVVYSLGNLGLSTKAQVSLSSPLGKSGRDTLLMGVFGVTREVAHDINNRLDSRKPNKLRAQDMEEALTMFPELKRMIEEARTQYPAPGDTTPTTEPAPNIGAPAGDTQRVADMATLAQIAAGTHPEMLEPELADQIEAAMVRYPDDAELQALAEQAINAYSDGMMAATAKL